MTVEYILDEQVDMVLAALTKENELAIRVALHNGLRISDVLSLTPDRLQPRCWVTEKKTGKAKQIGLPEPLLSELKKISGKTWVFESRTDPTKHRTRQAVWKDVKRAARLFRFTENVGTHSARKVYAVKLMQKYGDIEKVQRALNHDSPTITLIYAIADTLVGSKKGRHRKSPGRPKV